MSRSAAILSFTLVGLAIGASAANAHPKLVKSEPAADAVVSPSPKELRLSFNEDLVPKFSSTNVKNEKGQNVELGTSASDPADKKQMIVQLPKSLGAGKYTVEWHAVAADTHRVHGSYTFTVKQ